MARQRNVVFPHTVANEARFWRNLMSGRQALTWPQVVGFVFIFLVVVGVFLSVRLDVLHSPSRFVGYLIPFVVLGGFLLLIKVATRTKKQL